MDENSTYSWLDLAIHDYLIDLSFVEADKYDNWMRFLHDEDQPENIDEKA